MSLGLGSSWLFTTSAVKDRSGDLDFTKDLKSAPQPIYSDNAMVNGKQITKRE
jgi:hypothetical protein